VFPYPRTTPTTRRALSSSANLVREDWAQSNRASPRFRRDHSTRIDRPQEPQAAPRFRPRKASRGSTEALNGWCDGPTSRGFHLPARARCCGCERAPNRGPTSSDALEGCRSRCSLDSRLLGPRQPVPAPVCTAHDTPAARPSSLVLSQRLALFSPRLRVPFRHGIHRYLAQTRRDSPG